MADFARTASLLVLVCLFVATTGQSLASNHGLFCYEVDPSTETITITDYPADASGAVTIPAEIDGIPVTAVGPYAFLQSGLITSVSIPASVTSIGDYAFAGCTSLASANIPPSLVELGEGAFQWSGLTSVALPAGLTAIPDRAFTGCSSLTSVVLPNTIVSLGRLSFAYCSSLASFAMPPQLESIGERALHTCESLPTVLLPQSVTEIGREAFGDCARLTSIEVAPANPHFLANDGVLFDATGAILLQYPSGKAGSYHLPAGVTKIGALAFAHSHALTEVTLPEGLETIAGGAFLDCELLTAASLPSSLTTYGSACFAECKSLTSLAVAAGNQEFVAVDGVLFSADLTTLLQYPTGRAGPYRIPDTTSKVRHAFRGSTGLTAIEFSPNMSRLGGSEFAKCTALTEVDVPEHIVLGDRSIFNDCTALQRVTLRAPQRDIPEFTFLRCTSLVEVNLPPGLEIIDHQAFTDCYNLPSIDLPFSLLEIGIEAFGNCSSLRSVRLPPQVREIRSLAFRGCTTLEEVLIPAAVEFVRQEGFKNCSSLTEVTLLGDAPWVAADALEGTHPNLSFYRLKSKSGYTSPTWQDRPIFELDDCANPALAWLLTHEMPLDTDLQGDLNGDGVSDFVAYAFNLDPTEDLTGSLPHPEITPTALQLAFSGDAGGVRYCVETSTDLLNWTNEGVTFLSGPGGPTIASVKRDDPQRYLRLIVKPEPDP